MIQVFYGKNVGLSIFLMQVMSLFTITIINYIIQVRKREAWEESYGKFK